MAQGLDGADRLLGQGGMQSGCCLVGSIAGQGDIGWSGGGWILEEMGCHLMPGQRDGSHSQRRGLCCALVRVKARPQRQRGGVDLATARLVGEGEMRWVCARACQPRGLDTGL